MSASFRPAGSAAADKGGVYIIPRFKEKTKKGTIYLKVILLEILLSLFFYIAKFSFLSLAFSNNLHLT